MMKKRMIPAVLTAALALTAVPVAAAELTEASPAGDTSVTGYVADGSAGDVTYVISIPDKIDFGELQQPDSNESAPVVQTGTVTAEVIEGLQQGSRVAVLVKDAADTEENPSFRIVGQNVANSGKELTYSITDSTTSADVLSGTRYSNGYLVGLFQNAEESVELKLTLNQNQLFNKYLAEWAGNYKGTLNFYSTVASAGSFN